MGNYCSTGKKKDTDNASTKSDDSQYTLNEKNKKNKNLKEAPLADPEPISDISAQNTNVGSPTAVENNDTSANQHQIAAQKAPAEPEIPVVLKSYPSHLLPLLGKHAADQHVYKERKIVLYVLAATNDAAISSTLCGIYTKLRTYCASRGFELVLSNLHTPTNGTDLKLYEESKWLDGPLEAQGSEHALAVNCISEITRQSSKSYLIPLLLGNSLGTALLPLTIESQDFLTALASAEKAAKGEGKALLEKWYSLDSRAQPACYRLKAKQEGESAEQRAGELKQLLRLFIEIFTKDLKNSYLTTVVEQEINNTILMSQELARRCVWLRTANPDDTVESSDVLIEENARRLNNLVVQLKNILNDKNVLRTENGQLTEQNLAALESNIKSHIDIIVEEHGLKTSLPNCTHGINKALYAELETVSKLSQIFSQNCPTSHVFSQIKRYIQNPSCHPLVIHGGYGSGKTGLIAKLAQSIHDWLPDCCFAVRYAGLTNSSQDIPSILDSIVHQIGHIQSPAKEIIICPHNSKAYGDSLKALIQNSEQHIVIVVDSLELVASPTDLAWLPVSDLPENIKIIVTITETEEGNKLLAGLKERINLAENILHLTPFSDDQWKQVVTRGTVHLPDEWVVAKEKTPIHAKILCWMAWLGVCQTEDTSVEGLANAVLDILEGRLSKDIIAQIFALIIVRPFGVLESEMIDQLGQIGSVHDFATAAQLWLHFCWITGPLLLHVSSTYIMDKLILSVAKRRYSSEIRAAQKSCRDYYDGQLAVVEDSAKKYRESNYRKLALLPRYAFLADGQKGFANSRFITDLDWISQKIAICGAGSVLQDLRLLELKDAHVEVLMRMCENDYVGLNYDGQQFYGLLKSNLQKANSNNSVTEKWQEKLRELTMLSLEEIRIQGEGADAVTAENSVQYDKIVALTSDSGYFVVSISTAKEELAVWDVVNCKKIRTLTKVPQPTDLCPVGDYGVAVLCGREVKVLDLNEGCFKVTLKGVMNQKMPYFGLHDSAHLVCLSRNRMYVNLMNLESGDCVTTFKAGEDRFLNSLLVSGDGRILVCGDETQKPFPLLVWHLTQRKLLYDLRIPHHDFITSLSAITREGSYVCVVAKELDEPSPNFIVVYDLQSGTLFKKWKPACNTVALAISQTQTCVIAGLEDARILVWDLVTGNCKLKLLGHNAPVTLLKLDPTGKILLSGDKQNQDVSIRLWDLSCGTQLAVYTPPDKITTCEILSEGRFIVLALENRQRLLTLELKPLNKPPLENVEPTVYGKEENEGKVFEIGGK